ncbi:MAG: hypothetical protein GQ522_04670 [Deltaproteobacteria bacterium]|nr:hypothetical protein [Deltaproteobacteria bacterium]
MVNAKAKKNLFFIYDGILIEQINLMKRNITEIKRKMSLYNSPDNFYQ